MSSIKFSDCCFMTKPDKGFRLTWEITQYCPYNCEYCFTWSSPQRKKYECAITDVSKYIMNLVKVIDVKDVLITGGEPLSILCDIVPFLSFLNNSGIEFSFSSTLYDTQAFEKLSGYKPRAINLSVDPSPSVINAKSRFKSIYDKIEEKIVMVEKKGIKVKLTSLVNRNNFANIPLLLDHLTGIINRHNNIEKIAFNREYPVGYAAEFEPQKKSELNKSFKTISSWAENISVPVTLVNWDVFHHPLTSCPAGKNLISIMPTGEISPCSLLFNLSRGFRIGTIRDNPKILKERLDGFAQGLLDYSYETKAITQKCKNCSCKPGCGGCFAMMPIAKNHYSQRTCELSPKRVFDHERKLLSDLHHDFHIGYSPGESNFSSPKNGFPEEVEQKIRGFVKRSLEKPSDLAHTIEHIDQVVKLAKYISKKEGASLKITVPAAYFHDIFPREPAMHHMHTFKSGLMAKDFLEKIDFFSNEELKHIQYCIYTSSYGSFLLGYHPLSLEAKVVRDADWLDAIGARGVARVFAFNQAHGAKLFGYPDFDPEAMFQAPIDMNISGPDKSPIHHFQTKLLKIFDLLETKTGHTLGEKRHKFMVEFIKQYKEESDVDNRNGKVQQIEFKSTH